MSVYRYLIGHTVFSLMLLVSAISIRAESITMPSEWRAPTALELNDAWRNKDPNRYSLVKGDFNGDGVEDVAMLLVSLQRHEVGLFVFLAKKNRAYKAYRLDVIKDTNNLRVMGIAKVSPGSYKSACGKGYWDCKQGEPPVLSVKQEAIDFFKMESANSYFCWDGKKSSFQRVRMSD